MTFLETVQAVPLLVRTYYIAIGLFAGMVTSSLLGRNQRDKMQQEMKALLEHEKSFHEELARLKTEAADARLEIAEGKIAIYKEAYDTLSADASCLLSTMRAIDEVHLRKMFETVCTRAPDHTGPCNGLPCESVKKKMAPPV